ncbi:MAG: flagellar basal body rod protein FlgB [Desulfobacterales bacterium]|nr:flagellar basal body rod protein FlgB [Desulfobacterales bacterium]
MPVKSLFGKAMNAIERTLDITKFRHGLITSNVSNLDTPGYRTKEIDFYQALKDALEGRLVDLTRTHDLHFETRRGPAETYEITYPERGDWVDIDREMSKLSENNLRYQTGIEALLRRFSMVRYTITEGGR